MDLLEPIPELPQDVQPPAPPPLSTSRENPVFNLVDVLLIGAVALFAVALISLVAGAVLAIASFGSPNAPDLSPAGLAKYTPVVVALQTLLYLIVVGFMLLIVRLKYDAPFLQAISWNAPRLGRAALSLALGAALAGFSEVAGALLARWTPKSLPIEEFFRTRTSAYAMVLFGVLVAPLVEELFFRGFLYPALARRIGVAASVALTAAGFALLHESQLAHAWAPLLIIFTVGAVFTAMRAATRSVATTVIMHMGYNFTLFTLFFISTRGFTNLGKP